MTPALKADLASPNDKGVWAVAVKTGVPRSTCGAHV